MSAQCPPNQRASACTRSSASSALVPRGEDKVIFIIVVAVVVVVVVVVIVIVIMRASMNDFQSSCVRTQPILESRQHFAKCCSDTLQLAWHLPNIL